MVAPSYMAGLPGAFLPIVMHGCIGSDTFTCSWKDRLYRLIDSLHCNYTHLTIIHLLIG